MASSCLKDRLRLPDKISLIPFSQSDIPMVAKWLSADHVRRYWGDPQENLGLFTELPAGVHCEIIQAGDRGVGLIMWQHPSRHELDEAGLQDVPTSVVDIDIMIGEQQALGKGVGPTAIQMAAERTLGDGTVPYLIAACMKGNDASRRAFSKAGFMVDREFDDPMNGRCLLLVRRRPA